MAAVLVLQQCRLKSMRRSERLMNMIEHHIAVAFAKKRTATLGSALVNSSNHWVGSFHEAGSEPHQTPAAEP